MSRFIFTCHLLIFMHRAKNLKTFIALCKKFDNIHCITSSVRPSIMHFLFSYCLGLGFMVLKHFKYVDLCISNDYKNVLVMKFLS